MFAYDPVGNRIRKIVIASGDTTVVKYSYDGADLIFEKDDNDAVQIRYLYGPGIDHILESEVTAGIYQHFTEALGSVARITDDDGTVAKSMTYDSFGNIVREGGSSSGEQVSYTGRERETEFGLYYYRSRYYDPLTGRFMARDPLGFAAGDVNLYRYVGNNPISYTDPSGLVLEQIWNNPYQRGEHLYPLPGETPAVSYNRFLSHAQGRGLFTLMTEGGGTPFAGPNNNVRYVIDPANSNQVIDMRHFLVAGFSGSIYDPAGSMDLMLPGFSEVPGLLIEILQALPGGDPESAFHSQDFLSNTLGIEFFRNYYNPFGNFHDQLERFFKGREGMRGCK